MFQPAQKVFLGYAVLDPFSSFLSLTLCVGLGLAALSSAGFLHRRGAERGEFYALMMFATAGMSLLAISNELITIFVNIEVLSIGTYALTSYLRRGTRPSGGGLQVLHPGRVLLGGAAVRRGAALRRHRHHAAVRADAAAGPGGGEPQALVYCGVILVASGFAFKVAAVPFHMWTPDVYEGAPTPVTAFMSAGVKAAAFAALVRVFLSVSKGMDPQLPFLIFSHARVPHDDRRQPCWPSRSAT